MAEFNISGAKVPIKPFIIELDITQAPPPLSLLINPETLDTKFTPKVVESRVRWTNYQKTPYILQAHHDELDIISASNVSAMFYTNQGITSQERTRSQAWENVQQVLSVYKNNGMNFEKKPGNRGVIKSVGRVVITYDQVVYRGSFENFNLSEADDRPFNLRFTFDFKVTQMISIKGLSNSILQNFSSYNQQSI